jgi:hypothetical protein
MSIAAEIGDHAFELRVLLADLAAFAALAQPRFRVPLLPNVEGPFADAEPPASGGPGLPGFHLA